jgi:hypothetical protein
VAGARVIRESFEGFEVGLAVGRELGDPVEQRVTGIISAEPVPGAELELALLAGLFTVMAIGPGSLSIDSVSGIDPTTATDTGSAASSSLAPPRSLQA